MGCFKDALFLSVFLALFEFGCSQQGMSSGGYRLAQTGLVLLNLHYFNLFNVGKFLFIDKNKKL